MTTTTLEQFREQCTDAIFGIKREQPSYDMDQYVRGWNAGLDEAISTIAALPLPVMPEQAEPVTLDQAKVLGYIVYTEKDNVRIWYKAKNHNRALDEASENAWTLQLINIDEENSALLARIAELEAGHADALRDAAKVKEPVSQWIKCVDRMPEEDAWVIFYMHTWALGHRLQIAKKRDQWITMQNTMSYARSEATHWMTLPELPKD